MNKSQVQFLILKAVILVRYKVYWSTESNMHKYFRNLTNYIIKKWEGILIKENYLILNSHLMHLLQLKIQIF